MKRMMIMAVSAALVLAACSGAEETDPEAEDDPDVTEEESDDPDEADEDDGPDEGDTDDEDDAEADGTDLSELSGQLAVATYGGPTEEAWQESFGEPFAEQAPDVETVISGVPNPSSLAFTQEGDQQFDVLLVTGTNVAQIRDNEERLYEPIDPSQLSRADAVYDDLVIDNDDGDWVAVPVFITYYGIVINNELVEPDAIQSWADLADPQFEDQILSNSPFFFSTTDLPMFALANGGSPTDLEPGIDLFEETLPNIRGTIDNLAEAASQMASGEIAASPFYFSQYSQLVDGGADVDMVLPEEGGLLSPLYLMVVADSENVDNALGFMDLVLEPANQEAAGAASSYVPVVDDAELIDTIAERSGFDTTEDLMSELVMPDFEHLADTQEENTQQVEDLLGQ